MVVEGLKSARVQTLTSTGPAALTVKVDSFWCGDKEILKQRSRELVEYEMTSSGRKVPGSRSRVKSLPGVCVC